MELFIYNHLEELQEYTYPIICQEGKGFYTHFLFVSTILHTLHLAWLGVVLVYFLKILDVFILLFCF